MHLNPKAFGLTAGTLAGTWWFLAMGFSLLSGVGMRTIKTFGGFHPGFSYSWNGLALMIILHVIGGFIGGWLFATLYNKFSK